MLALGGGVMFLMSEVPLHCRVCGLFTRGFRGHKSDRWRRRQDVRRGDAACEPFESAQGGRWDDSARGGERECVWERAKESESIGDVDCEQFESAQGAMG